VAAAAFVALERRITGQGRDPLFDARVLRYPGVVAGVTAVLLVMAAYAGFLVSLTLHLQDGLGYSALRSGSTFALYAAGFATASLTWPRARATLRRWLPVLGPAVMGLALLGVAAVAEQGGWRLVVVAPVLFAGGVGHAWGFSPLVGRLSGAVRPEHAADLSGLILTSSLVGQVLGIAAFTGIYLAVSPDGSGHALAATCVVEAAVLAATAAWARVAVGAPAGTLPGPERPPERPPGPPADGEEGPGAGAEAGQEPDASSSRSRISRAAAISASTSSPWTTRLNTEQPASR
jgi:hypothetical protein